MKRIICVLLACLLFCAAGYAEGQTEINWAELTDEQIRSAIATCEKMIEQANAELDKRNPQNAVVEYSTGTVTFSVEGTYYVQDRNKEFAVVGLRWRNDSKGSTEYFTNLMSQAYQNGIGLEQGILFDLETNYMTSVLPGYEIVSYQIFELRDHSDITVIIDTFADIGNLFDDIIYTIPFADLQELP